MSKRKSPSIAITHHVEYTIHEYVQMARNIPLENMPEVIAALDAMCEDWGVTEEVINHFLHLKGVGEEELDKDEFEFKPKKIKTKLHYAF